MNEPVPQLWELGMDCEDPAAEGDALAEAELADVGLTDRMRGWRGREVRVDVADEHIVDTVHSVFRDAVLLVGVDADRLIPLAAVRSVVGPVTPAVAPAGRERASGLSVCRQWLGLPVTLSLGTGTVVSGELTGVGADHLQVSHGGMTRLVPWQGVSWVRGPI